MKKYILLILAFLLSFNSYAQTTNGGVRSVGTTVVMQLDNDARNIIRTIENERVAGGGAVFTLAERTYVNYIVTNFKAIGVWNKITALYGFVGGTAASHKWNWKDMRDLDAAYRATFPNGMTHNSNGVTASSASSQFIRTFLNNNVLSINSNHLAIYSFNITSGVTLGGYITSNLSRVSLNTTSFSSNTQTTTALSTSLIGKSGFTILNRQTSTVSSVENKGVNIGTQNISTTANGSVQEYRFFNRNSSASADAFGNETGFYVSGTINFSSIGSGLTDTEAIRMSNIVTFAQGILNRQ